MNHSFVQLIIKLPRRLVRVFFAIILFIPTRVENFLFHQKIEQVKITQAPVFILGHWRSGTTYLHTLMACDKQFGYLTNAQAFLPMVMLLGQSIVKRVMSKSIPEKRWDGVKLSVDSPQEEEFALFRLFGDSAYTGWHYPHQLSSFFKKHGLGQFSTEADAQKFKKQYLYLLKKLTLANDGQSLLLKNPINTGRIPFLLDLFPNARFIYLQRTPREVLLSAERMHEQMIKRFSITGRSKTEVTEFVTHFHQALLAKYEKDKNLIPRKQLIEIDYDFFISQPEKTVEIIYEYLGLDHYSKSTFQNFIQKQKNYQPANWEKSSKFNCSMRDDVK